MKNYSILRIIHAIAILALLEACNKIPHLCMGNVSSSDDDGPSVVHTYHYVSPVCRKRDKIADIAESHIGDVDWAYNRSKGNFPAGKWKCNKFVYDVLLEANACPLSEIESDGKRWPIRAADWVTNNYTMFGWRNMGADSSWQRGDVIAKQIYNSDEASGHCGIAVGSSEVVAAGVDQVSSGDHGLWGATVVRYWGVGRD